MAIQMPKIIYGTAWKKEQTEELVMKAIQTGFRGIDTAAQPKHYYEKGVGDALLQLEAQGINRQDIFIQTKFTPISGQDPTRSPYDPTAPLANQVEQSFLSSQKNLRTDFVDSLVLHSPLRTWGQMLEVWEAMERVFDQGGAKRLGISNCYDLDLLQALHQTSRVKPSVLQNRFYGETGYDAELRAWCQEHGITYQSFWTLTANTHILGNDHLRLIAQAHHRTEAQIFFRFLTQIGVVPLTGTRSEIHMKEDLEIFSLSLSEAEIDSIQGMLR